MNSNFTGFATVLAASVAWSYTGSPLVAGGLGYLGFEVWNKQRQEEVVKDTQKMFGENMPRLVAQVQEQAQAQQQSQAMEFNPTFSPTFNPVLNIEAPQPPAPPQAPQPSPPIPEYPQPPRAASTANYEPLAIDSALPTVDAPAMVGECQGHVLLSCRTGSGKTTFLQQAIAHAHALGAAIWVVDPKDSNYLGLERTPDYYPLHRGDDGAIPVQVLSKALLELDARIQRRRNGEPKSRPLVIILDEWVTILARSKSQRNRILELAQEILLMGREDGVFIWLVGQSHYSQACGFDRNLQTNFNIFALGRAGAWQSLELAVEDSNLVRLKSDRERLQVELLRLRQANRQEPICYSSHNGGSLAVLPHCPKDSLPDIVPPGVQLAVVPEPEPQAPSPDFVIPLEPEPGVARRVVRHG